jgi:putative MFS transporter
MATPSAAELAARLDRLPMTRHIWVLVTLISLGGGFELYDLFLTAYIAPGLVKANFFTPPNPWDRSAFSPPMGSPGSEPLSLPCSPGCLSVRFS